MCKINERSLQVLKSWRRGVRDENLSDETLILLHIFNGIDTPMYVARMDTHELLYTNRALDELIGPGQVGKKCYEALQGNDFPCDFCTNDQLKNTNDVYVWEFCHPHGRWYRCIDKAIPWVDGSIVRLEIAHDITDIKEKELYLKQAISIITDVI